jgi:hypothetical protein
MSQKGFVNIVLILFIVAIIAVGGYFVLMRTPKPSTSTTTQQPTSVAPTTSQTSPAIQAQAGWKTCKSTKLGFEIQYPSEWLIYFPSRSQGAAERPPIILNSCEDADYALSLGPKDDQKPTGIYVSACDTECLNTTIYKGARTLDEYLPKLGRSYTINTNRIDGEKVATTEAGLMVLFHTGSMYEIILFKYTDEDTQNRLLETMKFLK